MMNRPESFLFIVIAGVSKPALIQAGLGGKQIKYHKPAVGIHVKGLISVKPLL